MYLVYVLSKSGKPLMPTKRFGRVKGLLKSGKAKIVKHNPFTIQLTDISTEYTQPLTLGIDVGTEHIGIAVVRNSGEPVFLGELDTRNKDITDLVEKRKRHRMTRRRHNREKQKRRAVQSGTVFTKKEYLIVGCEKVITCKKIKPGIIKFSNKKRTDKWMTPTCNHLLITHKNFINKISAILPITKVVIEYAKFDIHKLSNSDIKGVQYQNGRKKGYTNTTEYVLCRDKHTCQMCGKKTGQMHAHHVIWRMNNGSDTPENMITLCDQCHDKAHKKNAFNEKIVLKFEGLRKRFTHPTILNSIMPKFYEWLQSEFPTVSKTYGYETKAKRREFDLRKDHWMDAYLVSLGDIVPSEILISPLQFKQFRRHNKANIQRQEDRKYYLDGKKVAVNRNKRAGQTSDSLKDLVKKKGEAILNKLTVKSATRPKRSIKPFEMGDTVKYKSKHYTVKGFTGNYLGFVNQEKYNNLMSKTSTLLKNQGICCVGTFFNKI